MKLKKLMPVALCTAMIASGWTAGAEAKGIEVYVDGEKMEFDTEAYIENDRVMIPMRSLFEKKGMRVEWQGATGSITATKENKKISMQIGNCDIVNDGVTTTYDVAANVNGDGRTMIPLRAVGENLGYEVEWDSESGSVYLTTPESEEETDDSWKENVGEINLDTMTVSGNGVTAEDNVIKITEGGDFTVTGTLEDGYIYVNTESRVKLRLSGASITNLSGSAIYFENADKCFITVSKGTENVLTDGSTYSDTELKGTLYAKDDLEIKGSGTLTINANYKHAIAGNDEIKIEEGNIIINSAAGDGIHVNDGLEMTGGSLDITAFADAVQSEGYVTLSGGVINAKTTGTVVEDETLEVVDGVVSATTSAKGIKAETLLTIDGAELNLDTTDHAIDCADIIIIDSGDINIVSKDKGISGDGDVTINDGNITIVCDNEGIESKNVLTINGGDIDITAKEDGLNTGGGNNAFGGMGGGMHRENMNTADGTDVNMTKPGRGQNTNTQNTASPDGMIKGEMPEGMTENMIPAEGAENGQMFQKGGMGGRRQQMPENMTPAGGMQMSENMAPAGGMQMPENMAPAGGMQMPENMTPPEGMPENTGGGRQWGGNMGEMIPADGTQTTENKSTYECHDLYINGGNITINAGGDGIDSNGKIYITGGKIVVDGPTNNGNAAIDTDSQFVITGGELIAVGSSGMVVAPNSSENTQCSLNVNFTADVKADSVITVADEDGNIIMEFTNAKVCRNLIYSSAELEEGKTYTVSADDMSISAAAQLMSGRGNFANMGRK